MNLIDAVKEMQIMLYPKENDVSQYLKKGYHVIVADKNNYGDNLLKYDYFIEDGVLYAAKMSNSTRESIVLTPEMAILYSDDYFEGLWSSYLSGRDVFYVDINGYMHEAKIDFRQFNTSLIKKHLDEKQVIFFNDPYSPGKNLQNLKKTKIKIIDNKEAYFIGKDALEFTVDEITAAELTEDSNEADIIILIMPNNVKADTPEFFVKLDSSGLANHKNAKVLSQTKELNKNDYSKTIVFWSGNGFLASLRSPEDAQMKALIELLNMIESLNKANDK